MVALVVGEGFVSLVCGASIVNRHLILTAAHCIDIFVIWGELLSSFHGVVGSNRWTRTSSTGTPVHFKDHYLHPKWDWATIKNDIGFLVTERPMVFGKTVAPLALNLNEIIGGGEPCYVTGWGLLGVFDIIPYQLQLLHVNTISHQACVRAVSQTGPAPHIDPVVEICTFHSPGHGMCNGDSGSALVSTRSHSQIGIVSWGFPCAIGAPDMFVRISGFKHYILDILARHH
ncbi:chymotrypsin-1-like [Anticarsia gemmatalis]|uniref:chymotrypsin-1-like n=1 Tax=Anticarsia gemmatalis TaxID=129554 RepID=UPI003F761708